MVPRQACVKACGAGLQVFYMWEKALRIHTKVTCLSHCSSTCS